MKIHFELVENGLDFIESAAESAAHYHKTADSKAIKYAVLHLASGIELVAKERLRREHWSLVFEDIDKAKEEKLSSGDFRSVDFDTAIERLKSICKVSIEPSHEAKLKSLKLMRNRLQHFSFEGSKEEVLGVFYGAWSFLFDFVPREIPEVRAEEKYLKVWNHTTELVAPIESFLSARWKDIEPALKGAESQQYTIIECPRCSHPTLIVDIERKDCLFCSWAPSTQELVDEWMATYYGAWSDPKERMLLDIPEYCGSCSEESFVEVPNGGAQPPNPKWVCLNCGYAEPPTIACIECGQKFTPDDWEEIPALCEECTEAAASASEEEHNSP